MDRRAFLRLLGMGAAGATLGAELDLERLLWVPKPIITVPAMAFESGDVYADRMWLLERQAAIMREALDRLVEAIDRDAMECAYYGMHGVYCEHGA